MRHARPALRWNRAVRRGPATRAATTGPVSRRPRPTGRIEAADPQRVEAQPRRGAGLDHRQGRRRTLRLERCIAHQPSQSGRVLAALSAVRSNSSAAPNSTSTARQCSSRLQRPPVALRLPASRGRRADACTCLTNDLRYLCQAMPELGVVPAAGARAGRGTARPTAPTQARGPRSRPTRGVAGVRRAPPAAPLRSSAPASAGISAKRLVAASSGSSIQGPSKSKAARIQGCAARSSATANW